MAFDYSVIRDRKFYKFIKTVFKPIFKFFIRIETVGVENVPKEGAFIIACNHIHFVDPVILCAESPRYIHFMGKQEAFKNPIAAWILTHFNTFPVNRGRGDKSAVEYAIKLIQNGYVIGIFPEGTRSKDLKPHEAKAGVALIARQTGADILPASVYCEKKGGLFRKITLRFGEIIKYEELGINEDTPTKELRPVANMIMDRIVALWEEGHCK